MVVDLTVGTSMTPEMIVALTGVVIAIMTGLPALIGLWLQGRKQSSDSRANREAIVAAQTTAELDRLYKKIEVLETKIDALEKADDAKTTTVHTLQEQLKVALARIEELVSQVATLKALLASKDKP